MFIPTWLIKAATCYGWYFEDDMRNDILLQKLQGNIMFQSQCTILLCYVQNSVLDNQILTKFIRLNNI